MAIPANFPPVPTTPSGGLDLLKIYGIKPEEWARPHDCMFSEGLDKMQRCRKIFLARAEMSRSEHIHCLQDTYAPDNPIIAETKATYEKERFARKRPFWQELTGLTRDHMALMQPNERRCGLTILINAVTKLTRWELKHSKPWGPLDEVPLGIGGAVTAETGPSLLKPVQRTIYWDPLNEICAALGIARSALSKYSNELQGKNANEIVDTIKAEDLHAKMRDVLFPTLRALTGVDGQAPGVSALDEVKAFISESESGRKKRKLPSPLRGTGRAGATGVGGEGGITQRAERADLARKLWNLLKAARQDDPGFDRSVYAQKFGIPSHQRLHRACMIAYQKTPGQIEIEVIEEFLKLCETPAAASESAPSHEDAKAQSHEAGTDTIKEGEKPNASARDQRGEAQAPTTDPVQFPTSGAEGENVA